MSRGFVIVLLGLFLVGCEGVIGGTDGIVGGPDDRPASGSPGASFPSQASMLRMTKQQHQRTVQDLLVHFLGGDAQPVLDAVEPVYGIIPDDPSELDFGELVGATFSRMSQNVGELHIRGYYDVAVTVADAIVQDDLRRQALFGDCVDQPVDDHTACIGTFIDTFGLWTTRRPLTQNERSFFLDSVFADDGNSYAATPQAIHDLLVAMMVSPTFLYFVENQGTELEDGLYELDAYELASRLSFHFWSSMPDEELFDAAADGSLLTEAGYRAQVERIYADTRTRATFDRFFFEWLSLYRTGDPFGGVASLDPQKMTFVEGYDVSPALRENMIDEVLEMTEYYRKSGTFDDLFTSNASFARTSDLAAIYEVPTWDGSEPLIEFPTSERLGLLGRGALLSAATVYTHPILRGVRIREDFMCDELGTPPANVNGAPDEATTLMTTRDRIEALTSPSNCNGCHQFINGLGFPLESFDALGRYRTDEMIIDVDGDVSMVPIELDATPYIEGPSDATVVSGPADLVNDLLDSGKLQSCFAKHYVRFALGLAADPAYGGDVGTIEALSEQITSGAPLADVFKGIAFMPAFKQRLRGDES
ncbi:MAG: DUF1592 domain-containing protein [Myxococcales bacterium]|nr:DUF1592 domain-containing protein [Myxococcales bacterium]MDH3843681.1 DUF1592 domain-containing protein [Myxococcales bacterium]